jgi:hypothetical protein
MSPWLKVDDEFPENDKVWNLSDAAFRLYVSGNCYAVKKLSDGWVPASRIATLVPNLRHTKETIAELIAARLWHETSKIDLCSRCLIVRDEKRVTSPLPRGGYMIHDFLHYNPPRWRVVAEREAKRRAGEAGGQASAQARAEASAQAELLEHGAEHGAQPRTPFPVPHAFSIEKARTRKLA